MTYIPPCGHPGCSNSTACIKPFIKRHQYRIDISTQDLETMKQDPSPTLEDSLRAWRDFVAPDIPRQVFKVSPETLRPLIEAMGASGQIAHGPCGTFMGIPIVVDVKMKRGMVKLEPWEGPVPPLEVNWPPRPEIKVDNPELDRISTTELDAESSRILRDNLFDLYVDGKPCTCPPEQLTGGDSHWWICKTCGKGWATFALRERGDLVDYENRKVSSG